ncbi:MAG: hypothetical protein K5988_06515 [Lachnospiraceae bacterium]|nr:hypothetical protein [Lachnospiraceae bacterium]
MKPAGKAILFAILALICLAILFVNGRKINLKFSLQNTYNENLKIKEFDLKPQAKAFMEHCKYYGKKVDKKYFFYFSGVNKEGESFSGYADLFGNPVYDNYAGIYYENDIKKQFAEAVDFEHEFPDLKYCIFNFWYFEKYTVTKKTKSYDDFIRPESSMSSGLSTAGYTEVYVLLNTEDYDTVTAVKKKLREADFPIKIEFLGTDTVFDDMTRDDYFNVRKFEMGVYLPFGDRFDVSMLDADLDKYSELIKSKYIEENEDVASVKIYDGKELKNIFVIYGDGTLEKYSKQDNFDKPATSSLTNEDYLYLFRFFGSRYSDHFTTVKDDSKDTDQTANVYLHTGQWIYGLIELDHLDSDFELDFEREDVKNYSGEESVARKLYSVKTDNEEIKPMLDVLNKYFN